MSRFFATASDSETETESSDGEEMAPKATVMGTKTFQWSDDEEDTKRVVRSAKDKRSVLIITSGNNFQLEFNTRFEEIESVIKTLKNHKKIKDMANVLSGYLLASLKLTFNNFILFQILRSWDGFMKRLGKS
jgi:translation initiation factor 3 subunit C